MVGGIINESKLISADYTVVERDEFLYVDTSAGDITLTLAQPTNNNVVYIKKTSEANKITITTENSKTIDGQTSYTLSDGSLMLSYFINGSENEFKTMVTSTSVINFKKTLTQAEARTLASANGAYGIELLPAVADSVYDISQPLIIYKATGGAFVTATIAVYPKDTNTIFSSNTDSGTTVPSTLAHKMIPNQAIAIGDQNDEMQRPNQVIYLWSSVEHTTYEGTIEISFDYKLVSV